MKRPKYTLADIMQRFGDSFLKKYHISYDQLKVMNDMLKCRSSHMGEHWKECKVCGTFKVHYNSCGNRHCPSCQGVNKEKWIMEREYDLLPVKYFHVVFTIPSQLRALFMQNMKNLYALLLTCSWQTINEFAMDPRQRIEGKIASISILHTWTQKLMYHPHVHCIVPEGGLNNQKQWKKSKGNDLFLFHTGSMAKKFKGKFLDYLYTLYKKGELKLNGKLKYLRNPKEFYHFKDALYNIDWVVNCKDPFNGPGPVMEYLGRYTHKIAVSNYRIVDIDNKGVTFSYLDRQDGDKKKTMWLEGDKFIQRFLWHVVPKGFVRIRHYGFLSCRVKKRLLPVIRRLFKQNAPGDKPKISIRDVMIKKWNIDPDICPNCKKGLLIIVKVVPPIRGAPFRITA